MLRSMVFAAVVALPMFAVAEIDPTTGWRACEVDADCVAVQGTCNLTAVNLGYKDDAVKYYRELAKAASCVERFWQPTTGMIPQCKPLAGSKATKDAEVVPHSTCAMVPKPKNMPKE